MLDYISCLLQSFFIVLIPNNNFKTESGYEEVVFWIVSLLHNLFNCLDRPLKIASSKRIIISLGEYFILMINICNFSADQLVEIVEIFACAWWDYCFEDSQTPFLLCKLVRWHGNFIKEFIFDITGIFDCFLHFLNMLFEIDFKNVTHELRLVVWTKIINRFLYQSLHFSKLLSHFKLEENGLNQLSVLIVIALF